MAKSGMQAWFAPHFLVALHGSSTSVPTWRRAASILKHPWATLQGTGG